MQAEQVKQQRLANPGLNRQEEARRFLLSIKEFPFEAQIIALVRFVGDKEDAVKESLKMPPLFK